jgi:transposase
MWPSGEGVAAGPFLREDQFERVYGLVQREPTIHTKDRARARRFREASYWRDHRGAQWRFLPPEYGGWNAVYQRCARWADPGVWGRLFAAVAADPEMQRVLIDATVVRAHACAAGAPRGKGSRRRRG